MERYNFDEQKAELLKKIEEALKQRNPHRIYTYSRMILDLENEHARAGDSRSLVVDFSVS